MKILIVDDDFRSRKLLQGLLAPYGECDAAADGKEALEAFFLAMENDQRYDLICLDIAMPDMNGHEVLERIRELEARSGINENHLVRVIIITGLADHRNVMKAVQGKCHAYLVKPIDTDKLLKQLEMLGLPEEPTQ